MQSGVEGLFHDAAILRRFVGCIKKFSVERKTYSLASKEFFDHVANFALATIEYVDWLPTQKYKTKQKVQIERQKIIALKAYWRVLHEFVKPAADGDTLSIPIPLLDVLSDVAGVVPAVASARVLILISQELNYFQYQHTGLKEVYFYVQKVIPKAPGFPAGLGFIGIPYSQGASFFTNLAVFHEFGHFVFEECEKASHFLKSIEKSLNQGFGKKFLTLSAEDQAWSRQLLLRWAEEIYCDLFAVRLLGPSYSFAFIELFSLMGTFELGKMKTFNRSHPSNACRFSEHLAMLKADGWWVEIKGLKSEYTALIRTLAGIPSAEYEFVDDGETMPREFVDSFLLLLPDIRREVDSTLPSLPATSKAFSAKRADIEDCLANGIVPSAVFENQDISLLPDSVAVINSAFCFYLESLSKLIDNIDGQDASNIEHRSTWTQKLETWTLKAIENIHLLDGQLKA